MQTQKANLNNQKVFIKKEDEKILVVKKDILFQDGVISGIEKIDFEQYQNLIEKNKEFIWRSQAETDISYKQIIPYIIFKFEDRLFVMQRKSTASEVRLQNKLSLGIGGHIREEDILQKTIFDWAKREFFEEIEFSGNFNIQPIGLLNDESNSVGQVHTGFVFLITGDTDKISIKSELKSGELLNFNDCKIIYDQMESWSQIVFDYLNK
ncbi:hypothetical protein K9M16_02565 [Candidatus Babeliales bacterium]|nr:hypothetical protein [Candidatus Babeliales bacterium]